MPKLARSFLLLAALILGGCYNDMLYGVDEKTEEEQEEAWWCKYRNNCEAKEADTWW